MHSINVKKYLDNRLSSLVVNTARSYGCEFFCGGNYSALSHHYQGRGFDSIKEISSNTSTKSYYVTNTTTGKNVLVLSNMNSEARIKHQLLQLHYADIDISKINISGSIKMQKENAMMQLSSVLNTLPDADKKVLFIGARWQIMEFLGREIYQIDENQPEGVGYDKMNTTQHKVSGFIFDTAIVENQENNERYIFSGLRMPNGDLSYDATKAFIEAGFTYIVMCGAGGRLSGKAKIGDYTPINISIYENEAINLKMEDMKIPDGTFIEELLSTNITVNSPLEETQKWLENNKHHSSVDVETGHIFRAVSEAIDNQKSVTITPGLFISDVVGEHPLEGKISTDDAYKNLKGFVASIWHSAIKTS
ncbi:hypothetical protein CTZ24_09300 [Pantoea phytobeneficialis]|nr:hypothetical protein CTZ24_09300 [Pantoea phytobeneficialis]